jgi:hypothetical protein
MAKTVQCVVCGLSSMPDKPCCLRHWCALPEALRIDFRKGYLSGNQATLVAAVHAIIRWTRTNTD